jgi:hypothetical protein
MARDDLHFRLRIPDELKARVENAASENRRSMTAEIIDRLEKSFQSPISIPGLSPDDTDRLVGVIVAQVVTAMRDLPTAQTPDSGN